MIRNNTQYIIGFVDSAIEEYEKHTSLLIDLNGYEVNVDFIDRITTRITILYNVKDQKREDDYKVMFSFNEFKTTKSEFSNYIELALKEMSDNITEIQND